MADITVDVNLPSSVSVDVTSPTQALATNISIPGPQGPRGAPTSINTLTAENIVITGVDGNVAYTSGTSIIFISGNSGYFQSAINNLTTNLNSTGANLNTSINSLSGLFTGYTGSLDATYATDSQLNSTGNTLNIKIDNLSGYVNSQDSNISNNLASTGSSLQSNINTLSSNLNSTGSNLENKITSLSGTLTGNYLTTNVASNTYATISNLNSTGTTLNSSISSLSGTLTNNYATISNLALTGFNLNTKIDNFSGTYQNFVDNLDASYATDTQLQNTGSTLSQNINNLSGTLTGNYYLKSNPSGFITGVDLSAYATSSTISSTYATILNLQNTGSNLQTQINNLDNVYATDVDITNLNNKITSLSGDAVLEYGNQTIQGQKTFTEDLVVQKSGFFWSGIKIGLNSIIINEESIKIAGDPVVVQSTFTGYTGDVVNTYATITNLASTGSTLVGSINSLSGTLTGNYLTTNSASNTYATILNLASTGSTLNNSISSLSGTLTSTYATINNLASTGSTLQNNISSTGSTLDNKIGSLSGTLTSTYATISNLANTGSTLNTKINDLSGYVNTQDNSISNNLISTGNTLQNSINSLSGSSVLLYGNQSVGGIKTFRDNVYINNLFVTGTETIVSTNNFNVQSPYVLLNLTGGAVDGGIFFVTGSGLTGVNDTGPIIGFDHVNKFKFGISTRNSDLSTLPDIASVQDIQAYSGVADNKFSTITNLASTGNTLEGKISSLSGTLTSNYATITNLATTGSTLQTNINNLSGYINSTSSNIVFTTGDQSIAGNKTLTDKLNITASANSDSTLKVGTLEFQPYTVNNAWLGDNTYYNAGFYRREAGYAGAFYFQGPEGQFRFADTDDAGTTYTPVVQLKTHLDGRFGVGSNISTATADFTNSNFFVDSNGKVGINTLSPSEKLEVNGNIIGNNLVYNTGNQTISGNKTFIGQTSISGNLNVTGNSNIRGTLDVTGLVVSGLGIPFILKSPNNGNSVYFDPTLNGNAGILFTNYIATIGLQGVGDQNLSIGYGGGGTRNLIFNKSSINRALLDSNGNFGIGSGISSVPSRFYVSGDSILQGNLTVSGNVNISGNYDIYSQIENSKKLAIAYAIAL
jgi:peptidoglycan hydrolase CwlO-like protein